MNVFDFNKKIGFFQGIRSVAGYPDDWCKDPEPIR